MTIHVDREAGLTVSLCDRCGTMQDREDASGVVPEGWMTGQLWLDLSLAEQKQIPICFCPDCRDLVAAANVIQIAARSEGAI